MLQFMGSQRVRHDFLTQQQQQQQQQQNILSTFLVENKCRRKYSPKRILIVCRDVVKFDNLWDKEPSSIFLSRR